MTLINSELINKINYQLKKTNISLFP